MIVLGLEMDGNGSKSAWIRFGKEMEVRVGREMRVRDRIEKEMRMGWCWRWMENENKYGK